MINPFKLIDLGIRVFSKENALQMLDDTKLLYPYVMQFKAGKLDVLALHKAGKLKTIWKAVKRWVDTIDQLLDDKIADEDLANILESVPEV